MHTQRRYATCLGMSKKKKEEDSPLSKKKEKERWCIQRSSYTIHQKYLHTCTSWLKFMTCFSFGSGLWLSKIWEASLSSILHTYSSTKIAIRDRLRKKGIIKSLGEELYTLSDPRDHPRNFINFFWKTLQNLQIDGWTKKKEIWALCDTILTLNRQRWAEAKVRGKNKRPTYSKSR